MIPTFTISMLLNIHHPSVHNACPGIVVYVGSSYEFIRVFIKKSYEVFRATWSFCVSKILQLDRIKTSTTNISNIDSSYLNIQRSHRYIGQCGIHIISDLSWNLICCDWLTKVSPSFTDAVQRYIAWWAFTGDHQPDATTLQCTYWYLPWISVIVLLLCSVGKTTYYYCYYPW